MRVMIAFRGWTTGKWTFWSSQSFGRISKAYITSLTLGLKTSVRNSKALNTLTWLLILPRFLSTSLWGSVCRLKLAPKTNCKVLFTLWSVSSTSCCNGSMTTLRMGSQGTHPVFFEPTIQELKAIGFKATMSSRTNVTLRKLEPT